MVWLRCNFSRYAWAQVQFCALTITESALCFILSFSGHSVTSCFAVDHKIHSWNSDLDQHCAQGLKQAKNFKGYLGSWYWKLEDPQYFFWPYVLFFSFFFFFFIYFFISCTSGIEMSQHFSRAIWALGLNIVWAWAKFWGQLTWGPVLFRSLVAPCEHTNRIIIIYLNLCSRVESSYGMLILH